MEHAILFFSQPTAVPEDPSTTPTRSHLTESLLDGSEMVPILPEADSQTSEGDWQDQPGSKMDQPLMPRLSRRLLALRYWFLRISRINLFRVLGREVTLGGLYLLLAAVVLSALAMYLYHTQYPSGPVKGTGYACNLILIVMFTVSGRNSFWGWLFGVSCERLVVWHKVVSFLAVVASAVHGIVCMARRRWNHSGWILMAVMTLMFVLLMIVRNLGWYRANLWIHKVGILLLAVFLIIHKARSVFIGMFIWALDVFCRQMWVAYKQRGSKVASARVVADRVVELRFPRDSFWYQPGQFCFLTIPEISVWEPHPFSFSSSPHQEDVTIHIKAQGDWTEALLAASRVPRQLSVLLEGPYGCPALNFEGKDKDVFVFVAGGIGATPMISYANYLISQILRGRPVKKLFFFWSVRDLQLVSALDQPDTWLLQMARCGEASGLDPLTLHRLTQVLDIRIHLTSSSQPAPIDYEGVPFPSYSIHASRMPLTQYLADVHAYASGRPRSKVTVFSCAPPRMQETVSQTSKSLGFFHHIENFEL